MPKSDSGDHVANGSKMVPSIAALNAAALQFMAAIDTRFAETCRKFEISEETAGNLLLGTLLLDEPPNAGAFESAWSDIYDDAVAATEAVHGVTIEADCYYVEVVANDTGDSVLCRWGCEDAIDP